MSVPVNVEHRPSPVMDEAKITSAITAAGPILVVILGAIGWASADDVSNGIALVVALVGAVAAVVNFLVPKIRARHVRDQVTPMSDPRAADGVTPLVPEPITPQDL